MRWVLSLGLVALALPASAGASTIMYPCNWDVCTVRPDGSHKQRLTHDGHSKGPYLFPQIAWNGDLMAFGREGHMYTADASVHHRHRIRAPDQPGMVNLAPVLRPDARQVFYLWGFFYGGVVDFRVCRGALAGDTRPHCGTVHGNSSRVNLSWGPGGKLVSSDVYDEQELCVTTLNLTCKHVYVARVPSPDSFSHRSTPSPDGRLVASAVDQDDSHDRYRIAIFDARTAKLLRYVTRGHADLEPAWSPDGRRLAFQRDEDFEDDRQTASICVVRATGGHVSCPVRHAFRTGTPTWGE